MVRKVIWNILPQNRSVKYRVNTHILEECKLEKDWRKNLHHREWSNKFGLQLFGWLIDVCYSYKVMG